MPSAESSCYGPTDTLPAPGIDPVVLCPVSVLTWEGALCKCPSGSALIGSDCILAEYDSCEAIYSALGQIHAADGIYAVNLPTEGATALHCLMDYEAHGGGWTALMKLSSTASSDSDLAFSDAAWLNGRRLNVGSVDPGVDESASYASMADLPITELLAVFPTLQSTIGYALHQPSLDFVTDFTGGTQAVTAIDVFNSDGKQSTHVLPIADFAGLVNNPNNPDNLRVSLL